MATIVQCPKCGADVKSPETASVVTCPKCVHSFNRHLVDEDSAPHVPTRKVDADDDSQVSEGWVNPYGAVAVVLATLAILNAPLVGVRTVTIGLAILGLLVVVLGLVMGKAERESKDSVWFVLGSALNGLVLFVVLFSPGLLNSFWGLDIATNEPSLQQLIAVPRQQPFASGKLLTADDWVDASKDVIRQDKVLVRVESVEGGTNGGISCLQVRLHILNCGSDVLSIGGFGGDKPVLTDGSGRSYAFLKSLKRKSRTGRPVYEDLVNQGVELQPDVWQDYVLLFEMPSRFDLLKVEVPASAWGRQGRCKFNITSVFSD